MVTQRRRVNSGPWSAERVRRHIGDPRRIRWIELSSTVRGAHLSCIDGRDSRALVGSPGGDAGEFVLALAAAERVTGSSFHAAEVERLLRVRIDALGAFFLHTDTQAFAALLGELRVDPEMAASSAGIESPGAPMELLRHLGQPMRESVLDRLVEPANIGCGHLRLMLGHAEEYGTRAELIRSFLRAFFRLWWSQAPEAVFSLLSGRHEEGAVVNVRSAAGQGRAPTRVPLISPSRDGRQIFVHHPEVSDFLRRRTALLLSGQSGLRTADREDELLEAIDDLARRQLAATVGHLARGLPVFDAVFSADGTYEVRAVSAG